MTARPRSMSPFEALGLGLLAVGALFALADVGNALQGAFHGASLLHHIGLAFIGYGTFAFFRQRRRKSDVDGAAPN